MSFSHFDSLFFIFVHQVISLIAALQQKTGTGLDRVMIQRLRRDVSKVRKGNLFE